MRRFPQALAASFLGLLLLGRNGAGAQTCFTLQSELAHLQQQAGRTVDSSRYERAFQEQADVMLQTEARARQAGCFGGGIMYFHREPSRLCRTLIPKLREMEANLIHLDRLRRQAGRAGNDMRMREIQAMLLDRRCGLPGEQQVRERVYQPNRGFGRGTFRTLCVRTCDGYYFPVSYSTTNDRFREDAETCRAMCPGAETRLYYHPNPGGGPEDMRSIDARPYSSLPTAFRFRTSFDPSCSCQAAGRTDTAAITLGNQPAEPEELVAQLPRPRPEPGVDPETLANRAGDYNPQQAGDAPMMSMTTSGGRPVRVVGPGYLGAPEQESLLITPVPN